MGIEKLIFLKLLEFRLDIVIETEEEVKQCLYLDILCINRIKTKIWMNSLEVKQVVDLIMEIKMTVMLSNTLGLTLVNHQLQVSKILTSNLIIMWHLSQDFLKNLNQSLTIM